jgi:hypothetical protein
MKSIFWTAVCLMLSLIAVPAGAVPVLSSAGNQDGVFDLTGNGPVTVSAAVSGAASRYTIGLFDLNQLTADVNDPDFARQALQADRVRLIQQAGAAANGPVNLTFDAGARLALVVLYDATLRDFSRGQNQFAPLFSVLGANGSHLISGAETWNAIDFTFAAQNQTTFFGGFFGSARGGQELIGVSLFNAEAIPPVTPEPATLALCGAGLALAGFKARRRKA